MRSEAETQQRPAAPTRRTADTKPGTTGNGTGSGGLGGLTSAAPAGGDKLITTKISGTVKWFTVRNGYGFINRNDTKDNAFVNQTAIQNSPRKSLGSVGDGDTVGFDVVEGEKGAEAADATGPGGAAVQVSKYAADNNHCRRYPHCGGPPCNYQQNYQNSETREKKEGSESAPEGQATAGDGSHLTTCGDPMGIDYSMPTLLCGEK